MKLNLDRQDSWESMSSVPSANSDQDPTHPRRKKYWNRTLTLRDGRTKVGCAIFGAVKDYTDTVVYFHGIEASRLQAHRLHVSAERLNIRVLAFDRPGYGLSTYFKSRKVSDFAEIVAEILKDHFRSVPVYLFAYSIGASYALATSAILSARQLKGMCIVAGIPPWYIAEKEIPHGLRRLANIVKATPSFLAPPSDIFVRLNSPRLHPTITERAASRPKAIMQDVALMTGDWHLDLKNVTNRKIKMFYARYDTEVTPELGRRFAQLLPHTSLKITTEWHGSILRNDNYEILKQLVGKHRGRRSDGRRSHSRRR